MISNIEIVSLLRDLSERLRVKGENEFKARAYENAADIIEIQQLDIPDLVNNNKLKEVDGFGEALVDKLSDLINNGKMQYYENIKSEVPDSLMELLQIDGLGHKKVFRLFNELGICSIDELEIAAKENKIQTLKGFSKKSESSILEKVEDYKNKKKVSTDKQFKFVR